MFSLEVQVSVHRLGLVCFVGNIPGPHTRENTVMTNHPQFIGCNSPVVGYGGQQNQQPQMTILQRNAGSDAPVFSVGDNWSRGYHVQQ